MACAAASLLLRPGAGWAQGFGPTGVVRSEGANPRPSSGGAATGPSAGTLRTEEGAAGSMSRISRLLGVLVTEETEPPTSALGLGSRRSLERWIGRDLPFDLSAFHGYQSRSLSGFERLSARQAGIAAIRRLGPATLYLGAGVEDLQVEFDSPLLRRLWEDGGAVPAALDRIPRGGTEGATPRLTLGAGLTVAGLRGSADFSMSGNPTLNVGFGIPLR